MAPENEAGPTLAATRFEMGSEAAAPAASWSPAILSSEVIFGGSLCSRDDAVHWCLRVIVSNPDCDEPLQIASLRSCLQDLESLTPLGCNLDHVAR
jgi:hypothetical protein